MTADIARTKPGLSMPPDRTGTLVTAVLGFVFVYVAYRFVSWAVIDAIWMLPDTSDTSICRASRGHGACWAVVTERLRFILLGTYPSDQHWRPIAACLLFVSLYAVSTLSALWRPLLIGVWLMVPSAAVVLLRGGVGGLDVVSSDNWGGLPLTFVLATIGFAGAFPLGVTLALGRRSQLPAIRMLSGGYVEIVRGVPLITVLFMASLMFPLFVPQGVALDKVLRAQVTFVLVIAAYLAEVVRAGLAAVPSGQYEAAASLGMSFWPTTILVVLPQALRVSIPALVNTFIGFFKDTSLVAVIGLLDLLGAAKVVLSDAKWVGFGIEVYLFVSAIYFLFCHAASRYSQYLERALAVRAQR